MKAFVFWVLFMAVGTVLVFLTFFTSNGFFAERSYQFSVQVRCFFCKNPAGPNCSYQGNVACTVFPDSVESTMATATSMTNRKLKESKYYPIGSTKKKRDLGNINLEEDYRPINPVPSSKASTKAGPIEHGTPLMPYIPKPTPPGHPKHGGSP